MNTSSELPNGVTEMAHKRSKEAVEPYCPECKEKRILSPVKRLQFEEDRYCEFCAGGNGCPYYEEFRGELIITKEDLIMYGLPGQLLDHIDIFHSDINKIMRFCMAEYIKMEMPAAYSDWEAMKDSVRRLAESHHIRDLEAIKTPVCISTMSDGLNPTEVEGTSECHQAAPSEDPVGLFHPSKSGLGVEGVSVATNSSSSEMFGRLPHLLKPCKHNLSVKEVSIDPTGFLDFENFSQTLFKTETCNKPQTGEVDEVVNKLVQICDEELSLPVESEVTGEAKLLDNHEETQDSNPYDAVKELANLLVADLPLTYQEDLKSAFSKIEGYNFPEDFANDTTTDKLPLLKILEERKRQEIIKAEVDETLNKFKTELDEFDLLL